MKIEDHLRNIKESLEVINESIQKGIEDRQRNIGFNTSVAAVEMLEVFLHRNNLINPGTTIKHDWFGSMRRAKERLNFDFAEKEKLLGLIIELESKRNLLCYGRKQPLQLIEESLKIFNKIKFIFESFGLKWN